MTTGKRAAAAEIRRSAGVPDDPSPDHDEPQLPEPPEPLPEIPRFPVDQLVGPLRTFVDWGIRDGLHPECAVAAGLAALVALTGPARLVLGAKSVKPILWTVLVGVASAGKSPAYEHAFAPLRDEYAKLREQYEADEASWRDEVEAVGKKQAGPPPERPEPYELDDATTEAVARWLTARGSDTSGSVVDDELAAFLEGLNQYKGGQGSDVSKWLKMWTGAPLHIQRVGAGGSRNQVSLYIPEPVVSVTGPLVPANLHLLGKPGSGFRPRWLPFYAPPVAPAWNHAGDYPGEWTKCIKALMEKREARQWRIAGRARTEWEKARQRWHAQQYEPEPDDVIEALRKADAQALRIALVIGESIDPGEGSDIPAEAVMCAISIVDYCISVWRALPGNSTMTTSRREDVMDTAHRRLLAWLETRPKGTEGLPDGAEPRSRASRREIQQWLHEPPNKINELIQEHRQRWPGCVVGTEPPGGGLMKIWVYSPPRGRMFSYSPNGVAATPSRARENPRGDHKAAGKADDARQKNGVASGVAPDAQHRSATPLKLVSGVIGGDAKEPVQ
jgi:hypothetical protein